MKNEKTGRFPEKKLPDSLKERIFKTIENINKTEQAKETSLFKEIHIGSLISELVQERSIDVSRICKFLKVTEEEVKKMYQCKSMNTEILLLWSKLLKYDFFRIYSNHLLLYAAPASINYNNINIEKSNLPEFKKNVYTKEIIYFIIELVKKNLKTKTQIIQEYNIPKTTLYRWLRKYDINNETEL